MSASERILRRDRPSGVGRKYPFVRVLQMSAIAACRSYARVPHLAAGSQKRSPREGLTPLSCWGGEGSDQIAACWLATHSWSLQATMGCKSRQPPQCAWACGAAAGRSGTVTETVSLVRILWVGSATSINILCTPGVSPTTMIGSELVCAQVPGRSSTVM